MYPFQKSNCLRCRPEFSTILGILGGFHMSQVLRGLVEDRKEVSDSAIQRGKAARRRDILRLVAVIVIALAVYRYHEVLFKAAQPIVNKAFSASR